MLLSAKEQCQRDLEERNDEIDKLASRIRELEQALLSSAEAGRGVLQLEQELQRAHKSQQDLSQVAYSVFSLQTTFSFPKNKREPNIQVQVTVSSVKVY